MQHRTGKEESSKSDQFLSHSRFVHSTAHSGAKSGSGHFVGVDRSSAKMAEKDTVYFKVPENLSTKQKFCRFLWNPATREFLGRTGLSWLKITIFYIIFYSCLATFWTLMLVIFYQTLDYYEPTWKLQSSRIGANPGLGFRPLPPPENIDSTLIWFKHGSSQGWKYWTNSLDKYLADYQKGQFGEHIDTCYIDKDYDNEENKRVCHFPIEDIGNNCTTSRNYGYDVGHPCVLIKLNRIYGWKPEPYDPEDLPKELPDHIRDNYDGRYVYISCQGENPADKENIGPLNYYPPSAGIPRFYFPFRNLEGYLSPFVFVHFEKPVPGVLINIECKAWAKNIKHDRMDRMGSVHFELLVD